jgi:predicted signal transduction protein with EAL and GGDEF domain
VNWSTVGVKAVFRSGCGDSARIQWARLRSKRWTTERGLHVGDPTAKLKQLYPGAEFTVGAFWLYKAYDAFVQGDAPIVTAQMKGGAVDFIRADVNPPK